MLTQLHVNDERSNGSCGKGSKDDAEGCPELGAFCELSIAPLPRSGLNIHARPFLPFKPETKRCTYCLTRYDSSQFSKSQWNARKSRARYQRTREATACEDLKAAFAAFEADGEPFTWRRCLKCWETNKCNRGPLGFLKKTQLAPDLSFLSDDDEASATDAGEALGDGTSEAWGAGAASAQLLQGPVRQTVNQQDRNSMPPPPALPSPPSMSASHGMPSPNITGTGCRAGTADPNALSPAGRNARARRRQRRQQSRESSLATGQVQQIAG